MKTIRKLMEEGLLHVINDPETMKGDLVFQAPLRDLTSDEKLKIAEEMRDYNYVLKHASKSALNFNDKT